MTDTVSRAARFPRFTDRLRTALGAPGAPLVLLGNFEVEEAWSAEELTLPRFSADSGAAVVNRMDEFTLLLAGEQDHVVLKSAPDPAYLAYLTALGLQLPQIHAVAEHCRRPERTVTLDALDDPELLERLGSLGRSGARLLPHGTSAAEKRLAERAGLPLATPGAELCKRVNSKIYSRRLAEQLGLRLAPGWACETLDELAQAFEHARKLLGEGRRTVVKEAFGVSGKGITMLDSERRMDRILTMVAAQARRSGRDRIAFVVEEWVENLGDLNYQFTVGKDGSVHFDFVKQALTEGGVHKGHRFPARLTDPQSAAIVEVATLLGPLLAADGYHGVVGVDALLTADGGVLPVVEINARNNMSTYQARLQEELLGPDQVALARHYPLRLDAELGFDRLRTVLDGLVLDRPGGTGLLVNNFATVNAGRDLRPGESFDGRLYAMVVAGSAAELTEIDEGVSARLAAEGVAGAR
ncbi:ATP-grasp domain-containing protein [Streptomyces sp. NPDC092296]|uniref:preATP grasp domain-containing protein n=1 Tax=Streptomyces sp. NPDC092296 TaxID=3366012 RepID=UPI003808F3B2